MGLFRGPVIRAPAATLMLLALLLPRIASSELKAISGVATPHCIRTSSQSRNSSCEMTAVSFLSMRLWLFAVKRAESLNARMVTQPRKLSPKCDIIGEYRVSRRRSTSKNPACSINSHALGKISGAD